MWTIDHLLAVLALVIMLCSCHLQYSDTWNVQRDIVLGEGCNGGVMEFVGPMVGVLKYFHSGGDRCMKIEADFLKQLHHPHICAVYGTVKHSSLFSYLLLERLGKPLDPDYLRG